MRLDMRPQLLFFVVNLLVPFTSASESISAPGQVVWTSPRNGDLFTPGQTITATWQAADKVISPSFSLCVEDSGSDDCGESIWPTVTADDGSTSSNASYTMSIIAPNITSQGSFFIKMKSDEGAQFSSPDFSLSPTGANATSVSSSLVMSSAVPTTTSLPSALPVKPSTTNPLAIGIPVAMLALALVGGLAFCMTRSRQAQRDAGGAPALLPSVSGMTSSSGKGNLGSGEATFFNISLHKTGSELSEVEKAVCGAISTGANSVPQRREKSNISDREMDGRYTAPPPKTWQRTRSRLWFSERQRQRALEREFDRQWEVERRERAKRRFEDAPYPCFREYDDERRSYTARSAPEYSERRTEDWYTEQSRPRSAGYQHYPSSSLPDYRRASPSRYQEGSRIPRPDTAASFASERRPTASAMRSEMDQHSSFSVVSSYFMPSPHPDPPSRYPQDPYSTVPPERDIPPSLQAGRSATPSRDPYFPPGLNPREYVPRAGHPSFDFEDRQASQFRFTGMGASTSAGSGQRYRPYDGGDMYGHPESSMGPRWRQLA